MLIKYFNYRKSVISMIFCFSLILSLFTLLPIDSTALTSTDLSISDNGIAFICAREGFHSTCYKDNTQSSIGYGTKCTGSSVQPHASGSHSITRERAMADMKSQIDASYAPRVRNQTTGITMNQNQFDALVSLCYNTGGGTSIISNSPLVKYLRGSYSESQARSEYSNYYVKSGGSVLQGLINRRNAEADLFFSGSIPDQFDIDERYPAPITAYPSATSGKITVYNQSLTAYSQSTRYISWNDLCTINAIYTNGYCSVTYPTSTGTNTEYARTSDFIPNGVSPYGWHPDGKMNTYVRSDMSTIFGSISSADNCTVVGKVGNKLQVIYPLNSGGYKLGWVDAAVPPPSDFPTPMIGYTASNERIYAHASLSSMGDTYGQVFPDDRCTLTSVSISGGWIYVTYPLSGGGSKSGYVYLNDFVPDSSRLTYFYKTRVDQRTDTFRKSDMAVNFGWVTEVDEITVVGKSGNKLQVLYPVDEQYGGGFKIAWIYNTYVTKNLTGLAVTSNPTKVTYLEGESLNTNGLVITASYDDGSTVNVTNSCSFSGYDNSPGVKTVTVSYGGKQTAFTVDVKSKSPAELIIDSLPNKTTYKLNEAVDFTGIKIKVLYDNSTSEYVTDYDVFCEDETFTASSGTKTIIISYMYNGIVVEDSYEIVVNVDEEVTVDSISIKALPTTINYKVGDTLNISGLSLLVHYNDNSTKTISSGFTIGDFDSSVPGEKQVVVTYLGKSASFTVTVEKASDENTPLFYIDDIRAVKGQEFEVKLCIKNNPGITALQTEIEFDDSIIELKEITHENLFTSLSSCSQALTSPFKISWFSQDSLNESNNGVLATLRFRVKDDTIAENTTITISYDEDNVFDSSFDNIHFDISNSAVSIIDLLYGDVNSDTKINMKDIVLLQQYLNKFPVTISVEASDVYYDGVINMKDIVKLQQYMNRYPVTLGKEKDDPPQQEIYASFVYGESEMGRDLVCHSFTPDEYENTVLLNFAIHGFEDEYEHDGQVLVDTANSLIEYYKEHPEKLSKTRLLIVPCANPDGVIDGYSKDTFGRCNASGIDLNRDFDANYVKQSSPRYYTQSAFSAPESRALRDLVLEYSPNVVLDFHGWLDETIGDYEIGQIFDEEMNLKPLVGFTQYNANGYFANWAHQQGALGLLIELKSSTNVQYEKLVTSVNRILNKEYVSSELDDRFDEYDAIDCYTSSTARTTTYLYFDKAFPSTSYIEGSTDKVTIFKVFDNGWVKCQYPTGSNYKIAYCELDSFINPDDAVDEFYEYTVSSNTEVYKRSDLSESFGKVYPTDKITVVAETENALQIIYPLDSGGYKMGWISK